jgi:Flp pilus assembly protein TadG
MTGHCPKSGPDEEQGQATLEFALVVMFLLLVVFGIVDFSRVFFGYATMSNGVREGARYAVVHPNDDAAIEQAARAMMVVIGAPVEISLSFPGLDDGTQSDCRSSRCRVVVTATSDFSVWTPIIPNFQMQASATMHIE